MLLMKSEEGYLLQTCMNCELQNIFLNQNLELNKVKTFYSKKLKIKQKIKSKLIFLDQNKNGPSYNVYNTR